MIEVRVAGILFNKEKKILLANHFKNNQSYWVLPGGRVESGETLEAALIREMEEETGLEVKPLKLVFFHEVILKKEKRHLLNFYFLLKAQGKILKKKSEAILKGVCFFSPQQLTTLDFRPKKLGPQLLKEIKNNFPGGPHFLGDLA